MFDGTVMIETLCRNFILECTDHLLFSVETSKACSWVGFNGHVLRWHYTIGVRPKSQTQK